MQTRWARRQRDAIAIASRLIVAVGLCFSVVLAGAVRADASPPAAVDITLVLAGPTVAAMTVTWTPPNSTGGNPIANYEYRSQVDGGVFGPTTPLGPSTARSATLPCAAPATAAHGCSYEVRANNGLPGAWSTAVGTTWAPPSLPTLGRADAGPTAGTAVLRWRPSKNTGGLPVSYEYEVNDGTGWAPPVTIDPSSVTITTGGPWPVAEAPVPCSLSSTPPAGCSYLMLAANAAGPTLPTGTRLARLRRPGPSLAVQAGTTLVLLGSGMASQTVTWQLPDNNGGTAVTRNKVFLCSTANGLACANSSRNWTLLTDLTGSPPATTASATCPANGRCGYEVWAGNAIGHSWAIGYAAPAPPTALVAVADPSVSGQIDLSWFATVDAGTTFGHYVLFECGATQSCQSGRWTTVAADAAPWTRIDLSGTATVASFACGVAATCMFRVGYVDAAGNIGGVSNSTTATGQ